MAERRCSVRLAAVGGKAVKDELREVGREGQRALQQVGDTGRQTGALMQNAAFQIQDFAVQVAYGTSATQALAQNLPQLLGGMGVLGAVAGAAVAVLVPLGVALFSSGEEAVDAAEKIGMLDNAIRNLNAANANFDFTKLDDLIAKYGELDAALVLYLSRLQEQERREVIASARGAANSFEADFQGLFNFLDEYERRIQEIMQRTGATREQALGFDAIKESVFYLNEEFGVTIDQALQIRENLEAFENSTSLDAVAASAAELYGSLEESSLAGSDLAKQLLRVQGLALEGSNAMSSMPGILGAAWDQAFGLAGELWNAASAALALAKNRAAGSVEPTADLLGQASRNYGMILNRGESGPDQAVRDAIARMPDLDGTRIEVGAAGPSRAPARSGGTRRGGRSAAADAMDQAADATEKAKTALESYAETAMKSGENIQAALTGAFTSAEEAFSDFIKTGKVDFRGFVTSIIADLALVGAKKFILGPIANALNGALGGVSGGGGFFSKALASVLHDGGIVGAGGPGRMIPAMAFAGAPRFHQGGGFGLRSDEQAAILQRGERVLSRAQNRAWEGGAGAQVNIYARDAQSFRQSRTQVAADIARAVGAGRRGM